MPPSLPRRGVLRVYRDERLWNALSQAGQDIVRETLSLEMGAKVLTRCVDTALAHKLGIGATT